MVGLRLQLVLPSLGWATRGQVAHSLVPAGDWTTGVLPFLYPDSALVAMGAFLLVRDVPWSELGKDEAKREGQRDRQNLCGAPSRGAPWTLTLSERTRSLPTGVHHIGRSARGREKPEDWAAPAVRSCRALRGCREPTLRCGSTLTSTYAQSRSSMFKRCLHANAHSHTFIHNHTCSPQLILICVHAGSTPSSLPHHVHRSGPCKGVREAGQSRQRS